MDFVVLEGGAGGEYVSEDVFRSRRRCRQPVCERAVAVRLLQISGFRVQGVGVGFMV